MRPLVANSGNENTSTDPDIVIAGSSISGPSASPSSWRTKPWIYVVIGVAIVMVGAIVVVGSHRNEMQPDVETASRDLVQVAADVDSSTTSMVENGVNQINDMHDEPPVGDLSDDTTVEGLAPTPRRAQETCRPSLARRRRRLQPDSCRACKRSATASTASKARANCLAKLKSGCSCDRNSDCGWSRDDEFWRTKTKDWALQCYCGDAGKYKICP